MEIDLNQCYVPKELAQVPAIKLKTIWKVSQDRKYRNTKSWATQSGLILVRTHAGGGKFILTGEKMISIPSWSFVILKASHIRKYYTAEDIWNFWWFEVDVAGHFDIPFNRVFKVRKIPDETNHLNEICDALTTGHHTKLSSAAAMLLTMIYQWCGELDSERVSADEAFIRKTVDLFYQNMSRSLNIETVAEEFGISSRWFRKKFLAATGLSPKKYYDNMRLENAMQMLKMNLGTVSDVSELFGYSSPYHFSREFKKHFGRPPSQIQ